VNGISNERVAGAGFKTTASSGRWARSANASFRMNKRLAGGGGAASRRRASASAGAIAGYGIGKLLDPNTYA